MVKGEGVAETLSDAGAEPAADTEKSCRGNRYCSFEGPFHEEHLAIFGAARPQAVGRCYAYGCGAYVCNRCAHRRPLPGQDADLSAGLEILCCPFDGEPLGLGDHWLVLDREGKILRRCEGVPAVDAALAADLQQDRIAAFFEKRGLCLALLGPAVEGFHAGEEPDLALAACAEALAVDATYAVAWMLRRECLERLGRYGEAWEALRALLELDEASIDIMRRELELIPSLRGQGLSSSDTAVFRYKDDLERLLANRCPPPPRRTARRDPGRWTSWGEDLAATEPQV